MKNTLLFLFMIINVSAFSQNLTSIKTYVDSACICLNKIANDHTDKKDFNDGFSNCLASYIKNTQESDSTLNTPEELNQLVSVTLKENCSKFNFIDSVYQHYASTPEKNFIVSTKNCQLLKNGDFISVGDMDSTIIEMRDSIQLLKFKSGAFTKSKVMWLGPCSYKIIRIESTDPYEKAMVKPGDERVIRIIEVKDKSKFTYELNMGNGRTYTGELIKLK